MTDPEKFVYEDVAIATYLLVGSDLSGSETLLSQSISRVRSISRSFRRAVLVCCGWKSFLYVFSGHAARSGSINFSVKNGVDPLDQSVCRARGRWTGVRSSSCSNCKLFFHQSDGEPLVNSSPSLCRCCGPRSGRRRVSPPHSPSWTSAVETASWFTSWPVRGWVSEGLETFYAPIQVI